MEMHGRSLRRLEKENSRVFANSQAPRLAVTGLGLRGTTVARGDVRAARSACEGPRGGAGERGGEGRVSRRESLARARRRARPIASGVFRTPACAERGARASIPRGKRSCAFAFHRARRARAKRRSRRTARPRARARNARDAFGVVSGGARTYLDGRTNEREGRALRRRGERVSVLFRDLLRRAKARGDRHCEDGRGGERGVRIRRGVTGKVRENTRGEPIPGSAADQGARARHPRALSGGMFPVSWLSAFARRDVSG